MITYIDWKYLAIDTGSYMIGEYLKEYFPDSIFNDEKYSIKIDNIEYFIEHISLDNADLKFSIIKLVYEKKE